MSRAGEAGRIYGRRSGRGGPSHSGRRAVGRPRLSAPPADTPGRLFGAARPLPTVADPNIPPDSLLQ